MLKLSLALAAAMALVVPSAGFAADADPQPDLDAFQKAVVADGLTCQLGSDSLILRENSADRWVIEFRCATDNDGRLGVFPKKPGGQQIIYNCAKAKIANMSCAKTDEKIAFPTITADIKKFEYSSLCKVAQTRLMGVSSDRKISYLEVKCDDTGLSGQVLQYDAATLKPMASVSCDDATTLAGGCRIPGAVKNQKGVGSQGQSGVAGVTRSVN